MGRRGHQPRVLEPDPRLKRSASPLHLPPSPAESYPMNSRPIERVRDALGVPLPPPRVIDLFTRLRNWLGTLHARLAPGQVLLIERLHGLTDNKALHAAVELNIPDLLHAGPKSASELAAEFDGDAQALDRLMRYLVSRQFFSSGREDRYSNNGASDILRRDHPYSWRPWVHFWGGDWTAEILHQIPRRIRDGVPATEAAMGLPFFEYVNQKNPAAMAAFNGAMASGSKIQTLMFAEQLDLGRFSSICDVGGGTGSVLAHLLRTQPQARGTVFDLPELAEDADRILAEAGLQKRGRFVGGDFFVSLPADHALYTLFAILHDWDDTRCVQILQQVVRAMPHDGRVMVTERPVPVGAGYDSVRATDMLMLTLGDGGRERSLAEYHALFESAGLSMVRQTLLPSLFSVFELAPAAPQKF